MESGWVKRLIDGQARTRLSLGWRFVFLLFRCCQGCLSRKRRAMALKQRGDEEEGS